MTAPQALDLAILELQEIRKMADRGVKVVIQQSIKKLENIKNKELCQPENKTTPSLQK